MVPVQWVAVALAVCVLLAGAWGEYRHHAGTVAGADAEFRAQAESRDQVAEQLAADRLGAERSARAALAELADVRRTSDRTAQRLRAQLAALGRTAPVACVLDPERLRVVAESVNAANAAAGRAAAETVRGAGDADRPEPGRTD